MFPLGGGGGRHTFVANFYPDPESMPENLAGFAQILSVYINIALILPQFYP